MESTNLGEFTKPIFENGRFKNPWNTWTDVGGFRNLLKVLRSENHTALPSQSELDKTLPVEKPDFDKLKTPPTDKVQVMWIGHASVLVQFDGLTILADPIFSDRCSPVQIIGPKRYRRPACKISELPNIDMVIISHNHYDHLDKGSVATLNTRFGEKLRWYVPMNTKSWMTSMGCSNVVEMTWWNEETLPGRGDITVACTPAQHFCNRSLTDRNKCLWASWVVKGPRHSFFFGGDTGYCEGFQQIGRKYGPFSFAAIPIGAYYPSWFMQRIHVNPEEAVKIHEDIKSQSSMGIHWGTFVMTREFYLEPKQRLEEELKRKGIAGDRFYTLTHGRVHQVEEN